MPSIDDFAHEERKAQKQKKSDDAGWASLFEVALQVARELGGQFVDRLAKAGVSPDTADEAVHGEYYVETKYRFRTKRERVTGQCLQPVSFYRVVGSSVIHAVSTDGRLLGQEDKDYGPWPFHELAKGYDGELILREWTKYWARYGALPSEEEVREALEQALAEFFGKGLARYIP